MRNNKFRLYILVALVIAILAAVVGCGSSQQPTATAETTVKIVYTARTYQPTEPSATPAPDGSNSPTATVPDETATVAPTISTNGVKPTVPAQGGNDIVAFSFKKAKNSHLYCDMPATVNGNNVTVLVFSDLNKKSLVPSFTLSAGATMTIKGKAQKSEVTASDYSAPVTAVVKSANGAEKQYTIHVKPATVPKVEITTAGGQPITDKTNYLVGTVTISEGVIWNGKTLSSVKALPKTNISIKGRGNSTWNYFEKKPFRIKFAQKTAIFDMGAARDWVLLSNPHDRTHMRNTIAYEMGKIFNGTGFVPRMRYVDVYINGEFQGLYTIGDQVEVDNIRVNTPTIKEKTNGTLEALNTGGYLLEWDTKLDNDYYEVNNDGYYYSKSEGQYFIFSSFDVPGKAAGTKIPLAIKNPNLVEIKSSANRKTVVDHIKNQLHAFEKAIQTGTQAEIEALINVDSFIDWYIVNEIGKNEDCLAVSSFYHTNRQGKLVQGPFWDFDSGFGFIADDRGLDKPTGEYMNEHAYIKLLLEKDWFKNKVKARWAEKRSAILALTAKGGYMDQTSAYISQAIKANYQKWDFDEHLFGYPSVYPQRGKTYTEELNWVRNWINQRVAFLDTVWK